MAAAKVCVGWTVLITNSEMLASGFARLNTPMVRTGFGALETGVSGGGVPLTASVLSVLAGDASVPGKRSVEGWLKSPPVRGANAAFSVGTGSATTLLKQTIAPKRSERVEK